MRAIRVAGQSYTRGLARCNITVTAFMFRADAREQEHPAFTCTLGGGGVAGPNVTNVTAADDDYDVDDDHIHDHEDDGPLNPKPALVLYPQLHSEPNPQHYTPTQNKKNYSQLPRNL